jgi:hypothetical protein
MCDQCHTFGALLPYNHTEIRGGIILPLDQHALLDTAENLRPARCKYSVGASCKFSVSDENIDSMESLSGGTKPR